MAEVRAEVAAGLVFTYVLEGERATPQQYKAASKGVIHQNQAAKRKSAISKRVAAL